MILVMLLVFIVLLQLHSFSAAIVANRAKKPVNEDEMIKRKDCYNGSNSDASVLNRFIAIGTIIYGTAVFGPPVAPLLSFSMEVGVWASCKHFIKDFSSQYDQIFITITLLLLAVEYLINGCEFGEEDIGRE